MTRGHLSLGPSDMDRVATALQARHAAGLEPGERFCVTRSVDGEWESVAFDLVGPREVFRFQARLSPGTVRPRGAGTETLLDFLDGVVGDWLAGGRETWPALDYSPLPWRGTTVWLRGGASRPDLEAEADRILAAAGGLPDDG